MTYNPNIPQPSDLLSDSQNDLLDNNQANNTWSSVDHYALDDMTANNGFHAHVTSPTPADSMHYATVLNTLLYGMQDNAGIGNLQYSRGPNNAVPGPVTTLQSSSAGISIAGSSSVVVLNFNPAPTPIPYCYGTVMAISQSGGQVLGSSYGFVWNGSNLGSTYINGASANGVAFQFSGTNLMLVNTLGSGITNVAWTLRFERIWTPT